MNFFWVLALFCAGLESFALWRGSRRLEYFAKPGVMLVLLAWLLTSAGLQGARLWFGMGLLLSLAGDIFLMISLDRFFLAGLVSFLLAHLAYVIGFNIPIPEVSAWSFILAVALAVGGARVIGRIVAVLPAKGQNRLRMPVIVYGVVISLMLLSAMLKLFDLSWNTDAALLVSLGAFLFYLSDIILAWNKFVTPIQNGRIYNIGAYHLGQIAIIAGVIAQFA